MFVRAKKSGNYPYLQRVHNEDQVRKDRTDREAIVAALGDRLERGDNSRSALAPAGMPAKPCMATGVALGPTVRLCN